MSEQWDPVLKLAPPEVRRRLEGAVKSGVITTVHQLAAMTVVELKVLLDYDDTVQLEAFLTRLRAQVDYRPHRMSWSALKARTDVHTVETGIGALPRVRSMWIYEFIGKFGAGKSMFAATIAAAVAAQSNHPRTTVMWIDTEAAFNPDLWERVCFRFNVDPDVLTYYRAADVHHLTDILTRDVWRETPVIVVVDSIIELYRAQFRGRELLQARQQLLHYAIDLLRRYTLRYNTWAVLTNQVIETPTPYGSDEKPAGGTILGHTSNCRILLRRPRRAEPRGVLQYLDCPGHRADEVYHYTLDDDGVH